MSNSLKALILTIFLFIAVVVVGFKHIESLNQDKSTLKAKAQELTAENTAKQKTITTMAYQQKATAEIDAKYYSDLTNAKAELSNLKYGIANGTIGLRIAGTCEMSGTTETTIPRSMGNAGTCRLSDSAQQDYYTLRESAVSLTSQVKYLQTYIKTICFSESPIQ